MMRFADPGCDLEWKDCDELWRMLRAIRGQVSDRKLRLFAVACCRRIGHLMKAERSQTAVAVAERYADGLASDVERQAAYRDAWATRWGGDFVPAGWEELGASGDAFQAAFWACQTAIAVIDPAPVYIGEVAKRVAFNAATTMAMAAKIAVPADADARLEASTAARDHEQGVQRALLRDIVGNPFRAAPFPEPALRSPEVVGLAREIYERRSFERMRELAAALEKAGCDNREILEHCRLAEEHVLGCWVLDLILQKR
jgi:hypothetical protein